jgi:hypothetical protein
LPPSLAETFYLGCVVRPDSTNHNKDSNNNNFAA